MLRGSEVLKKVIFWLENTYYIIELFLYELALVPFIYLRHIALIIKVAELKNAIWLEALWIPIGPFFSFTVFAKIFTFTLKYFATLKKTMMPF